MKVIKRFKRTLGKCLFACMVFNSVAPTVLAVERSMRDSKMQLEYMESQEAGLDRLIIEMVQKAASMDCDAMPSQALMRCYERIVNGHTTVLVADVMEAMPELLSYAIAKHEDMVNANTMRTNRPQAKAPRPSDPFAPGAPVGPILETFRDDGCDSVAAGICQIIKLLLIIKKRIGTVEDAVCDDSVLGILGDACEILGPDTSISQALKDILDAVVTQSNCCAETIAKLDCILAKQGPYTDCLTADQVRAITDPCNPDYRFPNEHEADRLIYCKQFEIEATVSACCEELTDAIDALEQSVREDFEITWSLIENIQTGSACCNQILDAIAQQTAHLDEQFDEQEELINERADELAASLSACCATIQDNFETTWSLITAIQTGSVCCDEILNAIDEQTVLIENEFDLTRSLIASIQTGSVCCNQILDAIADQTAHVDENFVITWSLLNDNTTVNNEILQSTSIIICKLDGFTCGSSVLRNRAQEDCVWEPNTLSLFEALNLVYCKQFEDTAFLADLIRSISCGGTVTGTCCDVLVQKVNDLECLLECKLGDFKDCNDCDNASCQCDNCECVDCDCNDERCPKFDNVSDGLSEIFCQVTQCCDSTGSNFIRTWSLIEACCEQTQSRIEACCEQTQSLITECCEQTQSNFEFTWSLIEHLNVSCSLQCDLTDVLTTLERDFEITWSILADIKQTLTACCEQTLSLLNELIETVTQCCDDLADDIFDTQTILCCVVRDLKETITECCDDLADDIYDTQTIILECCKETQSLIIECCRETQSLIIECCEQTQSNFEFTWSLIEHLNCDCTLSCDLTPVLSAIEECCQQTHSLLFEINCKLGEFACCPDSGCGPVRAFNPTCTTFCTVADGLEAIFCLVDDCCEQTQSNFEHTWSLIIECCEETQSLINNLKLTCSLDCDLTPVLSAIVECCEQTQSNFEHTWSIIIECCEETQSLINNLKLTCSLDCDLTPVLSAIVECCEQTQSNFEHTWSIIIECCEETQSLINNLKLTCSLDCDLTPVLSAIVECCEQTQSNFEHTWSIIIECCEETQSLINNLKLTCSLDCDLTPVLTAIADCCEQTQSNFRVTWNILGDIYTTITNLDFDCTLTCDLTPVLSVIVE
ncbi:MAG: hypothetical protein AB7F19_01420, partial [Candidatus Babeliales bacterium]